MYLFFHENINANLTFAVCLKRDSKSLSLLFASLSSFPVFCILLGKVFSSGFALVSQSNVSLRPGSYVELYMSRT